MARRRKEDAEKTRRRILASALSLFVRKGYERTTFNDIAARLTMTKGAVYWHFESKERLLVELVEEALAKFRRQLEELMPHGELTFPKVADMMVRNAMHMVDDPKSAEFFRLMKCQIKWSDDSMAKVREDLLAALCRRSGTPWLRISPPAALARKLTRTRLRSFRSPSGTGSSRPA